MNRGKNMGHTEVIRGRDFTGLHDSYCRCRSCKPPKVGERREARFLVVGAILALIVVGVIFYG
jgi:hypothetical protein